MNAIYGQLNDKAVMFENFGHQILPIQALMTLTAGFSGGFLSSFWTVVLVQRPTRRRQTFHRQMGLVNSQRAEKEPGRNWAEVHSARACVGVRGSSSCTLSVTLSEPVCMQPKNRRTFKKVHSTENMQLNLFCVVWCESRRILTSLKYLQGLVMFRRWSELVLGNEFS